MSRDEVEQQILELWLKSRIPITRAHVQYATGAGRAEVERWLDELLAEGALEIDFGGTSEIEYKVPGAERPKNGPETFAEFEDKKGKRARRGKKRTSLSVEEPLLEDALTLANAAGRALQQKPKEGQKSLAVSAGVSLLGPLGWLYAGHFKEAIPGSLAFVAAAAILPSFLLTPLLFVGLPLSALTGLVYAWQYNKKGKRTSIFLSDGSDKKKKKGK